MDRKIQLLDCTLRDGAYIVDGKFGTPPIKGIIKKLQDANVDIIECGWLKNYQHKEGYTYYHEPNDLKQYLSEKNGRALYTVMIDWDRYDLHNLPPCDEKSVDAIRIVFPKDKFEEGISVGNLVQKKGYRIFFQAANTLNYSDEELERLAADVNKIQPEALSIVDTFGAMYAEDLNRIVSILNKNLDVNIGLGFHSHNNQQLSFALAMQFADMLSLGDRQIILDCSLCGMGRGAGNAATELIAGYLNRKYQCNYDMNIILDAIDMYIKTFNARYEWGYSTPYLIAGMYCAHINNIAYLLENHRTNAKDMRNIIESLSPDERQRYDYDLLEKHYLDYQTRIVDDEEVLAALKKNMHSKRILLLSPGTSIDTQGEKIQAYIDRYHPIVIGINAICNGYKCDYIFFCNQTRYEYAKEIYTEQFGSTKKIVASNVKINTDDDKNNIIVNYNLLIKRGWKHFDNSTITCLRLMNRLHIKEVAIAGFDGFTSNYSENYYDVSLPNLNPENRWDELNKEIRDMFEDFKKTINGSMNIEFVTTSKFDI